MNQKTIKKILNLNTDFYNRVGDDFDLSRQSGWKGWGKVTEIIRHNFNDKTFNNKSSDKKILGVLDLGCGNGRFYEFLTKEFKSFAYTGLDNNKKLIETAKNKYGTELFWEADIFSETNMSHFIAKAESGKFDLIVSFGVTHHIPGKEFRKKWFERISRLVSDEGLLILTFWNYHLDKRFNKAVREIATDKFSITKNDLEDGDHFLGWGKAENAFRYFHKYEPEELKRIDKVFEDAGLRLVETFDSDGKDNHLNLYRIYRKTGRN